MVKNEKENHKDFFQDHIIYLFKHTKVDVSLIGVDMFKYTVLAHKNVVIEEDNYELELKVCKPKDNFVVARVTLYSKQEYVKRLNDPMRNGRVIRSINNPMSYSDSDLAENELAFCYQNIDLSKDPIEMRSRLEVHDSMKRKGVGGSLFLVYETLAREIVPRLKTPNNKGSYLIVRDNSDPKGWTQKKAEENGYKKIDKYDSLNSSFPTFVKYLK